MSLSFLTARSANASLAPFQLGFIDVSVTFGAPAGTNLIHTMGLSDATGVPHSAANPLPTYEGDGASITGAVMPAGGVGLTGWLSAIWKAITGTLAVSDPQNASYADWPTVAMDAPISGARAIGVICTVAGEVMCRSAAGNDISIPVNVGWSELALIPAEIVSTGTTATAIFYIMK